MVFTLHLQLKENIGHYSLFRNWMFALQRFSGIVTFVFIFMHLWQTTIQNTSLVKQLILN